MIRKDIIVKCGKKDKPGYVELPASFMALQGTDVRIEGSTLVVMAPSLTPERLVDMYNYAADLKARAAKRATLGGEGGKKEQRMTTTNWILMNTDESFKVDYMKFLAAKDLKGANEYLDSLWENEPELGGVSPETDA